MLERFTAPARNVIQLANQEAQRLHHDYLGADDLLLGLIKQRDGVAFGVLENQHVDLEELCRKIEELTQDRTEWMIVGNRPFTAGVKKIVEYSMEEQRNLGHSHIGTGHLLLGILRAQAGVTGGVLGSLNLNLDDIRAMPQTEPAWHRIKIGDAVKVTRGDHAGRVGVVARIALPALWVTCPALGAVAIEVVEEDVVRIAAK